VVTRRGGAGITPGMELEKAKLLRNASRRLIESDC
jgi:hypothetical protein